VGCSRGTRPVAGPSWSPGAGPTCRWPSPNSVGAENVVRAGEEGIVRFATENPCAGRVFGPRARCAGSDTVGASTVRRILRVHRMLGLLERLDLGGGIRRYGGGECLVADRVQSPGQPVVALGDWVVSDDQVAVLVGLSPVPKPDEIAACLPFTHKSCLRRVRVEARGCHVTV
jgi:hypothetical protein